MLAESIHPHERKIRTIRAVATAVSSTHSRTSSSRLPWLEPNSLPSSGSAQCVGVTSVAAASSRIGETDTPSSKDVASAPLIERVGGAESASSPLGKGSSVTCWGAESGPLG
jgi:hypothetical protein